MPPICPRLPASEKRAERPLREACLARRSLERHPDKKDKRKNSKITNISKLLKALSAIFRIEAVTPP